MWNLSRGPLFSEIFVKAASCNGAHPFSPKSYSPKSVRFLGHRVKLQRAAITKKGSNFKTRPDFLSASLKVWNLFRGPLFSEIFVKTASCSGAHPFSPKWYSPSRVRFLGHRVKLFASRFATQLWVGVAVGRCDAEVARSRGNSWRARRGNRHALALGDSRRRCLPVQGGERLP